MMSDSNFNFGELDDWTEKMFKKLEVEYPQKAQQFLRDQVNQCKQEALYRTPKGSTGNLKKGWKVKIVKKKGHYFGVLKNAAPHAHLIENGHITKNGGWWEGQHMLEKTMTNRQPFIDNAIQKLVDDVYDDL